MATSLDQTTISLIPHNWVPQLWEQSEISRISPKQLMLVTDFDGTLSEIVADPRLATMRPDSLGALRSLAESLQTVVVLSNRDMAELQWLVPVEGVHLIGDCGSGVPPEQQESLVALAARLADAVKALSGVKIEIKPSSIAIHFRGTEFGHPDIWATVGPIVSRDSLEVIKGRGVLEIHLGSGSKGAKLRSLVESTRPGAVVCFGDDENDRSVFDYVSGLTCPHLAIGVWSPEVSADLFAHCDVVVDGPAGAAQVLRTMVEWADQKAT